MIDAGVRHVAVRGDDGRIAGSCPSASCSIALLV
jgi:hypothetical protein